MAGEHSTTVHAELRDDLVRLVTSRLLDPLAILVESDAAVDSMRQRVYGDAEMWAAQLLGRDEDLAQRVALRLIAALYPSDEPFDPPENWWRTPLGRITARRVGHPSRERVSFAVAGGMLGITRQGVHDLAIRNKLWRHPDGGIAVSSIRARLDHLASTAGGTDGSTRA